MKPYSHTVNKHTHTHARTRLCTYLCTVSSKTELCSFSCFWSYAKTVCVFCFQGQQGEPGPKGDPGPYGVKGAKVWRKKKKNTWASEDSWTFRWSVMRYRVPISGRSWKRRWTGKAWKQRPTGTPGESQRLKDGWQNTDPCSVYVTKQERYVSKYLLCDRVIVALLETTGTKESAVMM